MSAISVKVLGDKVCSVTPYHPDFPIQARALNGKWDGKMWVFDARDEERVRTICKNIYGTDGEDKNECLVTLRLTAREEINWPKQGVYFGGRCICSATGRDSGARLGEGVVILNGKCTSGGSMKNWTTRVVKGTTFELRDLPENAPRDEDYWHIEEVSSVRFDVEPSKMGITELDTLLDEKIGLELHIAGLQNRVDEINALIAQANAL